MNRTPRATATVAITAALLLTAAPALAQNDDVEATSRTTFELQPAQARVHADMRVTLVNRGKAPVGWWGPIRTPDAAEEVSFSGRGVTTDVVSDGTGVYDTVNFPRLRKDKKRRIRLSYDLTNDIALTRDGTTLSSDYARFCWSGAPTDDGDVRALLPAGWSAVTGLADTTVTASDAGVVIEPAGDVTPAAFFACTDAFVTDLGSRVYVLAPSEQVITLDSWADDPTWEPAMSQVVGRQLRVLEATIGSALPVPELTVQQVARQDPYGQPSDYVAEDRLLLVGDRPDVPGTATIALARTWFDAESIEEPWLAEGLATWVGLNADGATCPPPASIGTPPIDLSEWQIRSGPPSNWDEARYTDQRAGACSIIEEIANALGPEAMTQVISAILALPEPAGRASFLDAIAAAGDPPGEQGAFEDEETPAELATRRMGEHGIGV